MIEEGLRITDREKQTRSRAIDRDYTPAIIEIKRSQPTLSAVLQLKAYVLDHQHRHTGGAQVRGILCAPNIPAMIRTLLTENGLGWRESEIPLLGWCGVNLLGQRMRYRAGSEILRSEDRKNPMVFSGKIVAGVSPQVSNFLYYCFHTTESGGS